jgi:hypothetical protein
MMTKKFLSVLCFTISTLCLTVWFSHSQDAEASAVPRAISETEIPKDTKAAQSQDAALKLKAKQAGWRKNVPWLPNFSLRLGFGFSPAYYSPANMATSPYVTSNLGIGARFALGQVGVKGYWRDLSFNLGWGLSKALTDNVESSQYARQVYSRNVGIGLNKMLYIEKYTGITFGFSLGFQIPASMEAFQSTLITSIAPGFSIGKTFLGGRISLGYSLQANFNFYHLDSGLYNPELAGIPGLNQRWGLSNSFSAGVQIVKGLSVQVGLNIGVGYSFADAYQSPDGPQVFGAENFSAADLASYAINEGNMYSISIGLSYRLNQYVSFSLGYANGGSQFEYQFDSEGNRHYVVRNPFKLENGRFSFGIGGQI